MITLAQTNVITGTVTSLDDALPIQGVAVVVKATTVGTVTDAEGNYTLSVPADAKLLQFMFVGMKSYEIVIGAQRNIDLTMETDILGLEEVVVTGLGVSREKKALGYSIQDVSGEELETAREQNVLNSLQGKLSGVQITNSSGNVSAGSRILIRGMSTFGGNNQPLFVVDGIAMINDYSDLGAYGGIDYGNSAMDLNPSDIESISVLKGANAAALYGSRAVNGVVLITTRSGKLKSGAKKGLGVSFESNWMWSRVLKLPDFQDQYGQGFKGKFGYVDGNYGGINDGSDESWGPPLNYIVQPGDLDPGGKLEWAVNAGYPQTVGEVLMLPQFDSPYDPVSDIRTPTPWVAHPDNVKNVFETGLTATNTLILSGANEKANFRLSISNQNIKGIIPNTDLKKNNVTLSAGLNVTSKLRVSGSATYISNRSDNIMSGGYRTKNILQSLSQWFGRQVDTQVLKEKWDEIDPKTGQPFNWNHTYHNNPYFVLNKNLNSRYRDRFMGIINLEWDFTSYLSLTAVAGSDWYTQKIKEIWAKGSVLNPDGRFNSYLSTRNQLTARAQLNFNKNFGDFSLIASAGGEYMRYNYHSNDTHVRELIIPDLYAVSNAAVPATTGMSESHTELQSVFATVNMGFKNYLFLDLTGRNDWTSTLPANSNSYFYPSVSIGFILTEALAMQSNILSYLKLRASYAEVGGSATAYQLQGVFYADDPFLNNPALTYDDTRPSLNLKPQNKKSIEFGTEIKLLKNRLGVDATWYKENTINQIMDIDINGTSGFWRESINAGNLQNQGWELTLWATPVKASGFRWDISMNWARNVNEVIALHDDLKSLWLYTGSWGMHVFARIGEPYGQMFGYGVVRENATPVYYDEDETALDYIEYSGRPVVTTEGLYIGTSRRTLLGNVMPDWFGGVNNNFSFGNFNFSFLIDFRKGGDQYSVTYDFGRYAGIMAETVAINDNGKNFRDPVADGGGVLVSDGVYGYVDTDGSIKFTDKNGDNVTEPVANSSYVNAESFYHSWLPNSLSVFDASFVKLREVILTYTFHDVAPWISGINVSLVGRNLWLIHNNMPHVDPENAFSAGNGSAGMNSNPIPSTRSMGFNLKFTF